MLYIGTDGLIVDTDPGTKRPIGKALAAALSGATVQFIPTNPYAIA